MRRTVGWILSLLLCVAAVACAAGKLGAGRAAVPEVLRAQCFEVMDSGGRARARLWFDDRKFAKLAFADGSYQERAGLQLADHDVPQVLLWDADAVPRAWLDLDAKGTSSLSLADAGGKLRILAMVAPNDASRSGCGLALQDGREELRAALVLGEGDQTALALYDAAGLPGNGLVTVEGREPLLVMKRDDRVIWQSR